MAEVVHEHGHSDGGNSMGIIMGVVLLIVALFLFVYYLLPAIQQNSGGTTVNVPDKIDVNVDQK